MYFKVLYNHSSTDNVDMNIYSILLENDRLELKTAKPFCIGNEMLKKVRGNYMYECWSEIEI